MKFECKKCKKTKDLYKVSFTPVADRLGSHLVCKDAKCCEEYMEQIISEEYEGMPDVHRNEGNDGIFKSNLSN